MSLLKGVRCPFLIIQNDPTCPSQLVARILQMKQISYQLVCGYYENAFINIKPQMYHGIVCMGSRATSWKNDEYPWMKQVKSFMRDAIYWNVPQLAICIGAQFLAEACGGKTFQCPDGAFCGEYTPRYTKHAKNDVIYQKIMSSSDFHPNNPVLLAHNDTFSLPKQTFKIHDDTRLDVKLLMYGKYPIVFKVGDYSYGIQSHPECDEWLREFWLDLDSTHYEKQTGISRQELMEQNKRNNDKAVEAGFIMIGDWIDMCLENSKKLAFD